MSALLLLLLFSVLLLVGFGLNGWTLAALILGLTMGLAAFMSLLDIEEVKQNWNVRRCDFDILLTSFLYKPKNDPRTMSEFTTENMSFCTRAAFRSVFAQMLTPLLAVLGQSMKSADVLNEAFNKFRGLKAAGMGSFDAFMKPFWDKFRRLGIQFSHVFARMYSAFRRVAGMSFAAAYSALSTVATIMNFTNFVIFIIKVLLIILCAMMIFLFFLISPLIALIILPVIWSMQDNGMADIVGPVANCFCFASNTWIQKKDGTRTTIDKLKLGDILEDGSHVEGILCVEKGEGDMYSLYGIMVSGSHLVWSPDNGAWIPVSKHSDAVRVAVINAKDLVYCLRTSTRNIPIMGLDGRKLCFRDWEELPLDVPEADSVWDEFVSQILKTTSSSGSIPSEDPLLDASCCVLFKTGEKRRLNEVQIGDIIYSEEGFTRITGIYKGISGTDLSSTGMTDGIWMFDVTKNKWCHPSRQSEKSKNDGIVGWHLTTESGSYWIEAKDFSGFVRDFTEVGSHRIHLTYPLTDSLLKKSKLQGESCNLDSLSQVF